MADENGSAQGPVNDPASLERRIVELNHEIERLQEIVARKPLPDTRKAITHKFDIAGHEGYITVGEYEDGRPGELFITMAKEGSTIGGLMDTIGTLTSLALQYNVPIEVLERKLAHMRFEPSGFTKNPDMPVAKSISDYLFRWLAFQYVSGYRDQNAPQPRPPALPVQGQPPPLAQREPVGPKPPQTPVDLVAHALTDTPTCDTCGALTVRNGACYKCLNCGNSMGCS